MQYLVGIGLENNIDIKQTCRSDIGVILKKRRPVR
jgi:hypothetical protein